MNMYSRGVRTSPIVRFAAHLSFVTLLSSTFATNMAFARGHDEHEHEGPGRASITIDSVNGAAPGTCAFGDLTIAGSGGITKAPGKQEQYGVRVDWSDGIATTTALTNVAGDDKDFTFAFAASREALGATNGSVTVSLYHVNDSGQDGAAEASYTIDVCSVPDDSALLTVAKEVDNGRYGSLNASDFTLHVTDASTADIAESPFAGSEDGKTFVLAPGDYTVSENAATKYELSDIAGDCTAGEGGASVSLEAGHAYSCTLTNRYTGTAPNHAPELANIADQSVDEFSTLTLVGGTDIVATDEDGDTLTFSLSDAPAGVAIDPLTGTLAWTPGEDAPSHAQVQVMVSDGEYTVGQVFSIDVNELNTAPVAAPTAASVLKNSHVTIDLPATDADLPAQRLTYMLNTLPAHGEVRVQGGAARYTPERDYVGSDEFTFYVLDSMDAASNVATVTVSVLSEANHRPRAVGQATTTDEDVPLLITLGGSDSDMGDVLTFSTTTSPLHGTLGAITGNTVLYTPDPNWFGDDWFTFTVSDGKDVSICPGSVEIRVNSVNDLPIISLIGANPFYVLLGQPFVDPGATSTDIEDGALPVDVAGAIDTNATGTAVFVYSATDSDGATASTTRTVEVVETIPVDVCVNLEGMQTSVPDGYRVEEGGICTLIGGGGGNDGGSGGTSTGSTGGGGACINCNVSASGSTAGDEEDMNGSGGGAATEEEQGGSATTTDSNGVGGSGDGGLPADQQQTGAAEEQTGAAGTAGSASAGTPVASAAEPTAGASASGTDALVQTEPKSQLANALASLGNAFSFDTCSTEWWVWFLVLAALLYAVLWPRELLMAAATVDGGVKRLLALSAVGIAFFTAALVLGKGAWVVPMGIGTAALLVATGVDMLKRDVVAPAARLSSVLYALIGTLVLALVGAIVFDWTCSIVPLLVIIVVLVVRYALRKSDAKK